MTSTITTELLLIRHAPSLSNGRFVGRTDVPADCTNLEGLTALRAAIRQCDRRVMSPALRCAQTAVALWPDQPPPEIDARLWEQDFGDWEGLAYAELPELGRLSPETLAAQRPPRGESFVDLCARAVPALEALATRGGRLAVVAHAGTIRAALTLAIGSQGAALAFQITPPSLTCLTARNGTDWSVGVVNWTAVGVPA